MRRILPFCVYFCVVAAYGAGDFYDRDTIAPAIVQLEQKRVAMTTLDGDRVELWTRKPGAANTNPAPRFETVTGTGFLLASASSNSAFYLVTAAHIATSMTASADIALMGDAGRQIRMPISQLSGGVSDTLPWMLNPAADVAVLRLQPSPGVLDMYLQKHFLPASLVTTSDAPPLPDVGVTVFGFPSGNVLAGPFAPLTRHTYPSSAFVTLKRADNARSATFFILEDDGCGAYAGAPIFEIRPGEGTRLQGLVHGMVTDPAAGRFCAAVPARLIAETLELSAQAARIE